jgi:mono/diheme cytochrome c family protein
MFDFVGVAGLVLLAALWIWLVIRARRAGNRLVNWVGVGLGSLLTVVSALAVGVALIGFYKINFPPRRPAVADIRVAGTPDQVARGARLALVCAGCHSPNGQLPLIGQNFMQDGPPAGTMYAANLTPAGEIKDWSDGEIIRAIREGVHKSGRSLIVMPSESFRNLSDADVQAIVAYLRSQPASGRDTPPTKLNVVGALFVGALVPPSAQPAIVQPIVAPPEGASAEYGKYLVSILACQVCHGENFGGRKSGGPGPPAGPNLTVIVPKWSVEDFTQTLRTGVDPYKHVLLAGMPWKEISNFANDDDLRAIYAYLHALTPVDGPPR